MNTIRFSKWLKQVEDFLEMEFDETAIDEAYRRYIDGWSVDDMVVDIAENFETETDYAARRGH